MVTTRDIAKHIAKNNRENKVKNNFAIKKHFKIKKKKIRNKGL